MFSASSVAKEYEKGAGVSAFGVASALNKVYTRLFWFGSISAIMCRRVFVQKFVFQFADVLLYLMQV